MSLHLTDPQLQALSTTHAGLHALVVAWRAAEGYASTCDDSPNWGPKWADAVHLSQDTIELAAAEAYWAIRAEYAEGHMSGTDSVSAYQVDDHWENVSSECVEKLKAIRAELEKA